MGRTDLDSAWKGWGRVSGKLVLWCPLQATFAPASRMYRVYGKKNIKLEPVPLKGASLDPR